MSKFVKNIKKDGNDLQFDLVNLHQSYINAIRRILMAEIPIYGLFNFEINSHSSNIFFDDMITHIISGIPILNVKKGTDINDVVFTLKVSVPKDSESVQLYSDDIQISDKNIKLFGRLPIIKLLPGEELDITIKPKLGLAKQDAHIFGAIEVPRFKHIHDKNDKYIGARFDITAIRNYSAIDILKISFDTLFQNLENIKNSINDIDVKMDSNIRIKELNTDFYAIEIDGYDHTMGNLIKCQIINMFPDIHKKDFIGYIKIHPTQETIQFKIKMKNAINTFVQAIDELMVLTKKVSKEVK